MTETLPSFKRPPVVETVLGVQFNPLPLLTNAHLGVFWERMGIDEWPTLIDVQPLPQQSELFGDDLVWAQIGALSVRVHQDAASRLQLKKQSGDRMVQIQNGRLHYNWLGQGGSPYVRFQRIRPEFLDLYAKLRAFVAELHLGEIVTNQWEVTYVNHLPKGTVWSEPADWQALFPSLLTPPPTTAQNVDLESFGGAWHYVISPRRGRLHVELMHGKVDVATDQKEAIIFKLTARGPIPPEGTFENGIDLGHAIIVKTFASLTSQEAQRYWEQE